MIDLTEPVDFDAAIDKLASKDLLPTTLNSEAIQRSMSADLRDRSFFSARVANADLLTEFKQSVDKIVTGKSDLASQRLALKQVLAKYEYRPEPGKEGSLEDLSSNKRLNLILNHNTQAVQGYGNYQQDTEPDTQLAYPAFELVRVGRRKVPRFWYQIWDLTRARIPGCSALPSPRMIALKGDPIWAAISDFGLPFPPFKFGSGMGVENVSWDECLDLGLVKETSPNQPAKAKLSQLPTVPKLGMNTGLKASAAGIDPSLLATLAQSLVGFSLVGMEFIADEESDSVDNRAVDIWGILNAYDPNQPRDKHGRWASSGALGAMYERASKGKLHDPGVRLYRAVTNSEAARVKEATGLDVAGYHHVVDEGALRHVFNQHGSETERKRGQLPVTKEDVADLARTIARADRITIDKKSRRGGEVIKYETDHENTTVVIEELRKGKKHLALLTMLKKRRGASSAETPSITSETFSAEEKPISNRSRRQPTREVLQLLGMLGEGQ